MGGKYRPLESFLKEVPAAQGGLTLSFEQIERILDDTLPPSARASRPWWGNYPGATHAHARAWLNAGWTVEIVDPRRRLVRFRRRASE